MTKKIILLFFLAVVIIIAFSLSIIKSNRIEANMLSQHKQERNGLLAGNLQAKLQSPMISIRIIPKNDTRTLKIESEGAQNNDLIVVSIDSKEGSETRPVLLTPNATDLFGIILVKRVGQKKTATLKYRHDNLTKYLQDDYIIVKAYLVKYLDLLIKVEDSSVKIGDQIIDVIRCASDDFTQEFQYVCRSEENLQIKNIFLNAKHYSNKLNISKRCSLSIQKIYIKSMATISQ